MSRTKMYFARRAGVTMVLGLLLLVALVLAGCGGEPVPAPTEPPAPTEVSAVTVAPTDAPTEPPAPTDVPTEEPTPEPTEAPTEPSPTATPTEEPTPEPVDDTGCITCHTDEETLKALAKEPEVTESLSEGEG
jgi:outer membrane biosynthesis protein TonB